MIFEFCGRELMSSNKFLSLDVCVLVSGPMCFICITIDMAYNSLHEITGF